MDDLQLAAQLGKALLERNQMLEVQLEQKLAIIEDNHLQIEYLQKQAAAQREVNESRMLIYDSLEVNIVDLETTNARLMLEKNNANRFVKSMSTTNETLMSQLEVCNRQLVEMRSRCNELEQKNEKLMHKINDEPRNSSPESSAADLIAADNAANSAGHLSGAETVNNEGLVPNCELHAQRRQCMEAQQRIDELEEQLASLILENQSLNKRIESQENAGANNHSMHDELFGLLVDGRPGWMPTTSRMLRNTEQDDDMISYDETDGEGDEGISTPEATSLCGDMQPKYEAAGPGYAASVDSAVGSTRTCETVNSSSSRASKTDDHREADAQEASAAAAVGTQSPAESKAVVEPAARQDSQAEARIPSEAGLRILPNKRIQQTECPSSPAKTNKKNRRKSRNLCELGADATAGSSNQRDSLILPTPPRVFFASNSGGGRTRRDMRSATLGNAVAALSGNLLRPGATAGQNIMKRSAASESLHKLIQLDVSFADILRRTGKEEADGQQ